ncbi:MULTISPECIES: hypothetical protein [unclassified Variovorax]|jgi:hypothetical protein|uniref:AbrB/MazE/SpoVT family DNA-binding domain-containing protein n=1 Tax=unclassified Variovorax TaxID=663243 RepID=UPI0008B5E64E|nr:MULTISPECIES: hypothetical protein [unclassified Variovorax]SEK13786.1 hypothetical protein SAMN05518853_11378 [Variovorax sp. OK202]SFD91707.1 hypothetical protein SAMN05444746_11378 [Variovorax sp. OK212]
MTTALQIIQIDGEAGVILPDEVVARWGLQAGDAVLLTPAGDGVTLEFVGKALKGVEEIVREIPR